MFGALLVYLIGILARASAFANPWIGVEVSVIVDTVALALVWANRHLMRALRPWLRGHGTTAYILASASIAAVLIILFTRLLGVTLPAMASPWTRMPSAQFVYFACLFIAWAVADRWLDERVRTSNDQIKTISAEHAIILSEMHQLRMRLNPHFLFNALNMLAIDIHDRPRRALLLLRELNQYLRYSLDNADRPFVPIALEVAGIRSFMRVQQMRYGSSLKSRITVAGSLRGHRLPTFLLQPLIENATKHGVPTVDGILSIILLVVAEPTGLTISVTNDGDLDTKSTMPGTGVSLTNLRRRLALHYPNRHTLTLAQQNEVVVATLILLGDPC